MKVAEAKQLAVDMIVRDVGGSPLAITIDRTSPDGDAGKFVLHGRTARAIHHFDGWYVPINLSWFAGSFDPPEIHRRPFPLVCVRSPSPGEPHQGALLRL